MQKNKCVCIHEIIRLIIMKVEMKMKNRSYIYDISRSTISFIIFWDFSMFYQIFLSTQVERWAIITYKHGIYELPHKLPNASRIAKQRLKTQDPRKLGSIRKVPKPHRMIAQRQAHAKIKAFLILAESSCKTEIKPLPLCAISHEN